MTRDARCPQYYHALLIAKRRDAACIAAVATPTFLSFLAIHHDAMSGTWLILSRQCRISYFVMLMS